jgi:hypothetical protein
MSTAAKKQLLQTIVNIATSSKFQRNRIAAARVVAQYMRLNLGQQAIDLAREKLSKGDTDWNLSQLVAEAEAAALEHKPAERPAQRIE